MKYAKASIGERFSRSVVFVIIVAPATGLVVGALAAALIAGAFSGGGAADTEVLQQSVMKGMRVGSSLGGSLGLISAWSLSRYPLVGAWLAVTVPAASLTLALAPAFGTGCVFTGLFGYAAAWAVLVVNDAQPRPDSPDYLDSGAERVVDDDDEDDVYPPA